MDHGRIFIRSLEITMIIMSPIMFGMLAYMAFTGK